MADRTSAALFAGFFETLASGEPLDPKKLWLQIQSYDFHPCQMGCDEALVKLGLAKKYKDESGDEHTVYANATADGWEEAY